MSNIKITNINTHLFSVGINNIPITYLIGIDVQEINTYILEQTIGEKIYILLQKQIHNDAEFKEEVLNLQKYFEAKIIGIKIDLDRFFHPSFGINCFEQSPEVLTENISFPSERKKNYY